MKVFKHFVKNNYLVVLMLLAFSAAYCHYAYSSGIDIVIKDQIRWITFIDQYFKGDLSLLDIWKTESRSFIGIILFILNAKYFSLNIMLGKYMGAVVLFLYGISLFAIYRKTFENKFKNIFIQLSFLFSGLLIFSLNKNSLIFFSSLGSSVYLKLFVYFITFIVLDKYLQTRKTSWLLTLIGLIIASFLPFASAGLGGVIGAIFVTLFIDFIITKNFTRQKILPLILIVVFVITGLLIIGYSCGKGAYGCDLVFGGSVLEVIKNRFLEIGDVSKFVLNLFSAAVILGYKSLYGSWQYFIGVIVSIMHILALILFFKTKMHKKTYLPLMLILFSFFLAASLVYGRFNLGITYSLSPRYTLFMHYGLIGIIWIYFYQMTNRNKIKYLLGFLILLVFTGQIFTNYKIWNEAVYMKNAQKNIEVVYIEFIESNHSKDYLIEKLGKTEVDGLSSTYPYNLDEGLHTLYEYRLSTFRE